MVEGVVSHEVAVGHDAPGCLGNASTQRPCMKNVART